MKWHTVSFVSSIFLSLTCMELSHCNECLLRCMAWHGMTFPLCAARGTKTKIISVDSGGSHSWWLIQPTCIRNVRLRYVWWDSWFHPSLLHVCPISLYHGMWPFPTIKPTFLSLCWPLDEAFQIQMASSSFHTLGRCVFLKVVERDRLPQISNPQEKKTPQKVSCFFRSNSASNADTYVSDMARILGSCHVNKEKKDKGLWLSSLVGHIISYFGCFFDGVSGSLFHLFACLHVSRDHSIPIFPHETALYYSVPHLLVW